MQFAVALVEYLISGIIASVWFIVIVVNYIPFLFSDIKEYKEIFVIVYFPIAYILGIYVDATTSFLVRRCKEIDVIAITSFKSYACFRCCCIRVYNFIAGKPKGDSYERSAEILSHSIPDIVRTMDAYVSRDRIARGVAFNSFAGAITTLLYAPSDLKKTIFLGCLISFIYSLFMYKRLRRLSSRFKRVALSKMNNMKVWE
ncbi:hypothetical protein G9409_04395 [Chlorobium sp. BLA1]|uniref:hypothetical protein n=1 Tax=Candidatus Chlorobium masyuteum TaxID=2716876 RepID=UPI0014228246|nr:hypothetical protein [Candidatus Chlorobium masyuteum]NHQ59833.1 hypothetical protein [Candidatus Chlorobium masyuteum]